MKLACGKAKHCRLRCVFLTWNQLALHKYRGFLSQQRSEAGRAVRRVRRGRGLSVTSAPATVHLQAGSWKGGCSCPNPFYLCSFPFCYFMFFFLWLGLKLCVRMWMWHRYPTQLPPNTRPGGTACVGRSCLADGT